MNDQRIPEQEIQKIWLGCPSCKCKRHHLDNETGLYNCDLCGLNYQPQEGYGMNFELDSDYPFEFKPINQRAKINYTLFIVLTKKCPMCYSKNIFLTIYKKEKVEEEIKEYSCPDCHFFLNLNEQLFKKVEVPYDD
jgi:transposase-like protein